MTNKSFLVLIVLGIVILSGVLLISCDTSNSYVIYDFNIKDYQDEIVVFPSDENIGEINDINTLMKKIEKIWIKVYGDEIKKEKPYKVFYDEKNDVWLIHGTLPDYVDGGVAYAIVDNKTGKVLAVWHDK